MKMLQHPVGNIRKIQANPTNKHNHSRKLHNKRPGGTLPTSLVRSIAIPEVVTRRYTNTSLAFRKDGVFIDYFYSHWVIYARYQGAVAVPRRGSSLIRRVMGRQGVPFRLCTLFLPFSPFALQNACFIGDACFAAARFVHKTLKAVPLLISSISSCSEN